MIDTYYTKMRYIANALSDIEYISTTLDKNNDLNYSAIKVEYQIRNLLLAGFTEEYTKTLLKAIRCAVKKELLKTERILMGALKGELGRVTDSLTAEEEYQNGKE